MEPQRRFDPGAVIIGVIILAVGGYFLLRNTFGIVLPDINWDMVWPLAVIAIGIGIVWRAWERGQTKA